MKSDFSKLMKTGFAAVTIMSTIMVTGLLADEVRDAADETPEHASIPNTLRMPIMNPVAGRELFASKGCVACHAVNGVGGEDSASLDAHDMEIGMNPFDLAAKMWTMAPVMIAAQEEAFDEQITFTGEELANLTAFLHDDAEQHKFTQASLSPEVLKMIDHLHEGEPGEEVHKEELGHD